MQMRNRLSDSSKSLIAHIQKHGPQGLNGLRPVLGVYESELHKRLRNLCVAGWLEKLPGAEQTWAIHSDAKPLIGTELAPKKGKKKVAPPKGDIPLPRQINVMQGTYNPPPFTPARAGCEQFLSIASLGLRC